MGTTSWRRRRNVVRSQQRHLVIPAMLAGLFGDSSRTPPPSCATFGTADIFGSGY